MNSTVSFPDMPDLSRPLNTLKGIGPTRESAFYRRGISSIGDLLEFLPSRYEDRSRITPMEDTSDTQKALVKGKVVYSREERPLRRGKGLFKIIIEDDTGRIELIWFNYRKSHLSAYAEQGLEIRAYGTVRITGKRRQMAHPDISDIKEQQDDGSLLGYYPVYPAIEGISAHVVRSVVREALNRFKGAVRDPIPADILERHNLPGFLETLEKLHFPPDDIPYERLISEDTPYHKRIVFGRFLGVMLRICAMAKRRRAKKGITLLIPEDLLKEFQKAFPFKFTRDQVNAIREIMDDLQNGSPMSRLLQGDVGCGKTVVAAAAASAAAKNGLQTALMSPTQVLAGQHFAYFSELSPKLGFRPVLLTGALDKKSRLELYRDIEKGSYNLVIGTQALIQEAVTFSRLGLVIIDEQHRFGVRQRNLLNKKGHNPHLLVMTATPIPRTLAMTIYGDLDITTIRQMPEGRRAVITHLVDEGKKRKIFNTVRDRMEKNEQVLVVCPVIEESEEEDLKNATEMYESLKRLFSARFRVELIHGRIPGREKDRIMEAFRKAELDLLVGTTVVEVGVHAPNATLLVVEHPERFGLAQLHQLRGRVGRGSRQGVCLLIGSDRVSEEALARLKVIVASNDGFEIASKDLEARGQGQFMGTRQAGAGELDFSEMLREHVLLEAAKSEAREILALDPDLSKQENRFLASIVDAYGNL